MKKKIILKVSEGLGNQLFMYANAYSLKRKYELDLFLDIHSGYNNNKAIYDYALDNFNITAKYAPDKYTFASSYRKILKRFSFFLDNFRKKKKFIFEKKNTDKTTSYSPINIEKTDNFFFLDGNFESEKYFIDYKDDLLNELSFKNPKQFNDNKFLKLIKTKNVVAICVRQHRYSKE